jgi:hypothetical protein
VMVSQDVDQLLLYKNQTGQDYGVFVSPPGLLAVLGYCWMPRVRPVGVIRESPVLDLGPMPVIGSGSRSRSGDSHL